MKTTIELSDDLFFEAKRLALSRRTTLRALVESGLRRELAGSGSSPHPLTAISALDPAVWEGVEADRFIADERAKWE